jgi:hypothetical protein
MLPFSGLSASHRALPTTASTSRPRKSYNSPFELYGAGFKLNLTPMYSPIWKQGCSTIINRCSGGTSYTAVLWRGIGRILMGWTGSMATDSTRFSHDDSVCEAELQERVGYGCCKLLHSLRDHLSIRHGRDSGLCGESPVRTISHSL